MTKSLNDREPPDLDSTECLWIGFLGVKPLEGCEVFDGDPIAGAYVYFVVNARDADEFRYIANATTANFKMNIHDLKQVMPWSKWIETASNIDPYLVGRANESMRDGKSRFGEFHRYLAGDDETSH